MRSKIGIKSAGLYPQDVVISVKHGLIMMHSPIICSQWPLNGVGIQLTHQGNGIIKLGFMGQKGSYQSFYFQSEYHETIDNFFKGYSFPMHKPVNDREIKEHKN